ncbi:hypothetical protein QVN85_12500 [Oscillibacter valericigenes]|nr:hypothetical protein [Oscillibacter valericigenes]
MSDRHQAPYIPFRCSQQMSAAISDIAREQHITKSEVLRNLVDKGLTATGAKVEDGEFYQLIQQAVKETMQPQIERLAAISAKATHISGAAFFMSIFAATRDATPAEQREIEEAAGAARDLGIQYLKLKDQDIDAFLKSGAKRMVEETEE